MFFYTKIVKVLFFIVQIKTARIQVDLETLNFTKWDVKKGVC